MGKRVQGESLLWMGLCLGQERFGDRTHLPWLGEWAGGGRCLCSLAAAPRGSRLSLLHPQTPFPHSHSSYPPPPSFSPSPASISPSSSSLSLSPASFIHPQLPPLHSHLFFLHSQPLPLSSQPSLIHAHLSLSTFSLSFHFSILPFSIPILPFSIPSLSFSLPSLSILILLFFSIPPSSPSPSPASPLSPASPSPSSAPFARPELAPGCLCCPDPINPGPTEPQPCPTGAQEHQERGAGRGESPLAGTRGSQAQSESTALISHPSSGRHRDMTQLFDGSAEYFPCKAKPARLPLPARLDRCLPGA